MNPWLAVLALVGSVFGGGTVATIIAAWMNRKATDATATGTLEKASSQFRDEIRKDNAALKRDIHDVKLALILLTDLVAELLPHMTSLSPSQRKALQEAVIQGKLAA